MRESRSEEGGGEKVAARKAATAACGAAVGGGGGRRGATLIGSEEACDTMRGGRGERVGEEHGKGGDNIGLRIMSGSIDMRWRDGARGRSKGIGETGVRSESHR